MRLEFNRAADTGRKLTRSPARQPIEVPNCRSKGTDVQTDDSTSRIMTNTPLPLRLSELERYRDRQE
jgi:hypothetical protein